MLKKTLIKLSIMIMGPFRPTVEWQEVADGRKEEKEDKFCNFRFRGLFNDHTQR